MLYKPNTNTRSKRGLFGIVTTTGQSGPHMRRLAFPVQTRSAPALAWRQIFCHKTELACRGPRRRGLRLYKRHCSPAGMGVSCRLLFRHT